MDIKFTPATTLKSKPKSDNLGFGKVFTDYMFTMEYEVSKGWFNPQIKPYAPISLNPAASIFHYSQTIFEGLKAYRLTSNPEEVVLFRAEQNAQRLNRSADRLCMPELDVEIQLEAIQRLVDLERDWVPYEPNTSLYIRPTMIADSDELGAHAATRYIFFVILSPSGTYFKNGLAPVKIHIEDHYVRAVRGGMGFAKTGGNYACSFKAQQIAGAKGFDQVLWLDGRENKYIQEVGAMNMMFVMDNKIVTPSLGDSILPGITRDSVLTLAKDLGMTVEVREIAVDEIFETYKAGKLTEAFGTGTAAVIAPVGTIDYRGESIVLNNGVVGEVSGMFYDTLVRLQRGEYPDNHHWIEAVKHTVRHIGQSPKI